MSQTLFTNAHLVLDGFTELQRGYNVLVSDGRIAAVSTKPIEAGGATVVDVGGRTLMPIRPPTSPSPRRITYATA